MGQERHREHAQQAGQSKGQTCPPLANATGQQPPSQWHQHLHRSLPMQKHRVILPFEGPHGQAGYLYLVFVEFGVAQAW